MKLLVDHSMPLSWHFVIKVANTLVGDENGIPKQFLHILNLSHLLIPITKVLFLSIHLLS